MATSEPQKHFGGSWLARGSCLEGHSESAVRECGTETLDSYVSCGAVCEVCWFVGD